MTTEPELTDLTISRAALASWVFVYHLDLYLNFSAWLGPFAGVIRHGYLGVDGFFVLSGMILARVHPELVGHKLNARLPVFHLPSIDKMVIFWLRRLARIYPVHLAVIVLLALLLLAGAAMGWAPREPERFGHLALLQNLFLVQGWGFVSEGTWNYPSWSVSTEWAGYLMFPIIWYLLAYWPEVVSVQVLVVCLLSIGLIFHSYQGTLNVGYSNELIRFFPEFISGICLSRIVAICADYEMLRKSALYGGAAVILVSLITGLDFLAVMGLATMLFAFLMQADAGFAPFLPKRPALVWLGRISYSFYMSFAVAELLLAQGFRRTGWTPESHAWLFAAGMLGATLVLAAALNVVVEVPCRRWANRWLDARAT